MKKMMLPVVVMVGVGVAGHKTGFTSVSSASSVVES